MTGMPNPTANALHVDSLLTNMSIGYKNLSYIADEAFPIVPVQKQSDIIPQFDQSHWFRDQAVIRAPGPKSQRAGWKVTTDETYYCQRFSFGAARRILRFVPTQQITATRRPR